MYQEDIARIPNSNSLTHRPQTKRVYKICNMAYSTLAVLLYHKALSLDNLQMHLSLMQPA